MHMCQLADLIMGIYKMAFTVILALSDSIFGKRLVCLALRRQRQASVPYVPDGLKDLLGSSLLVL